METRNFSMIRSFHLADFLTLGNAACGVAGVFCAMAFMRDPVVAYFYAAALLAPAAFAFDVMDGRVARARQQNSALGRELDSLADVISFGVAPAALGFAAGMNGGWDWIALIYFVGVTGFGGVEVSTGVLIAFVGYANNFWNPVISIGNFYNQLITCSAYLERIFETLDVQPEIRNAPDAVDLPLREGLGAGEAEQFNQGSHLSCSSVSPWRQEL